MSWQWSPREPETNKSLGSKCRDLLFKVGQGSPDDSQNNIITKRVGSRGLRVSCCCWGQYAWDTGHTWFELGLTCIWEPLSYNLASAVPENTTQTAKGGSNYLCYPSATSVTVTMTSSVARRTPVSITPQFQCGNHNILVTDFSKFYNIFFKTFTNLCQIETIFLTLSFLTL